MNASDNSPQLPGFRGRGFTLVEILVVLALLGLLSAILAPMLVPTPARMMRDTGHQLMVALRETRRLATSTGQPQGLMIDAQANRYRVGGDGRWHDIPSDVTLEFTTATSLADDRTGKGSILFYPDGSSSGGRITLGAGGQGIDLNVAWLTGRISIDHFTPP